jgi:hypothetical protein
MKSPSADERYSFNARPTEKSILLLFFGKEDISSFINCRNRAPHQSPGNYAEPQP